MLDVSGITAIVFIHMAVTRHGAESNQFCMLDTNDTALEQTLGKLMVGLSRSQPQYSKNTSFLTCTTVIPWHTQRDIRSLMAKAAATVAEVG